MWCKSLIYQFLQFPRAAYTLPFFFKQCYKCSAKKYWLKLTCRGETWCLALTCRAEMHDLTLHWAAAVLGLSQVLLTQQVDWLMLVDLHTGTYVVVSMQEEGEGTGQMLTEEEENKKEEN